MKILLDSCTFLWVIWDSPRLTRRARQLYQDPGNQVFLSAVSCWEMSLKYRLGKLHLAEDPAVLVPEQRVRHGIAPLPLAEDAALQEARLPAHHRDPFDRMLIAQAIIGGMTILSPDRAFDVYPVKRYW